MTNAPTGLPTLLFMALADFIVLNHQGPAVAGGPLPGACQVSTCLRDVRIGAEAPVVQPSAEACESAGFARHTGADAYQFLLQLACGLESEIAGETEILGQIKESWRQFEAASPEQAAALRPWMQRLLQDTKEIRSEYVVGLGSATYGSLVRRLIGADPGGTTLLLGAGQLAETVLPYLDSPEVLVCNRNVDRARELVAKQRQRSALRRQMVIGSGLDEELAAWRHADFVVLAIPADAQRDAARVQAWRSRMSPGRRVLHLGIQEAAGTAWEEIEDLVTLRDLFGLRDTQASQREAVLARARKACFSKAQLARLDDAEGARPGSTSHGWEDLAVFQAFG